MKQLFLFALLLSACQEPHFNTQSSHDPYSNTRTGTADISQAGCPVSLIAVKRCIKEELFDFVDDYERSKERDRRELAEDLLSKQLFQYCGEKSGFLEKLENLKLSGESQCKNAALMESLLTFLDDLTLAVVLKVIRNDTFR